MYFTDYVQHDGYYESLCSLRKGLGPILKCRVVKDSKGNYEIVSRDHETGKMIASRRCKVSLSVAQNMAHDLTVDFIKNEVNMYYENEFPTWDKFPARDALP